MDALWRGALRLAHGLRLVWWSLRRPTVVGAHVVVRWEGRVLVVRNSYRRALGLPAGRVGWGEEVASAACRELAEEVGLRARPAELRFLGVTVGREEFKHDHAHLYELVLEQRPEVRIDHREVVWAGFRTTEELRWCRVTAALGAWLDGRWDEPA